MKKLISMTDFVLEQSKLNGYDINDSDWIERVVNYANFLKQPLELEMFVPCDDEGNILEEPKQTSLTCSFFEHQQFFNKQKKYDKAKEKVLFEGCSTMQQGENTIVIFKDSAIWLTWTNRIVEDLLKDRVILTKKALKQIGL